MGTLPPGDEKSCLENYLLLGLKGSRKEITIKPKVLAYLSSFLERTVEKNEELLETTHINDVVTVFHGSEAPALGIGPYIERIFKYSCCSPSCFILAYVYIERFIQRTRAILTSLNVHRLVITSVMVAAKFIDDAFYNNAYYARVGGVSTSEMNKLEMKFLFGLEFRLHVTVDTFAKYCSLLLKEGNGELQIELSLHACRIQETWLIKDDSSCPTTKKVDALTKKNHDLSTKLTTALAKLEAYEKMNALGQMNEAMTAANLSKATSQLTSGSGGPQAKETDQGTSAEPESVRRSKRQMMKKGG